MTKTAKTVSPFEHDERTVPTHWGSALINADYSGIEDAAEVARIKEFAADLAADGWSITGNGDYSDIQVFEGLQTECTAFEIMREKVPSLVDGDTFTVTRQTDGRVAPTSVFSGSISELKAALPALAAQDNKDAWIYLDRTRDGRTSSVTLPSYTVDGVSKAVQEIAPPAKLTIATVKAELAAVGMTITKNDDELRVNFKGGSEDHAYYAGNIDGKPDYADALATGKSMAAWKATTTEKFGSNHSGLKGTGPAIEPKLDGIERAAEAFAESLAGPVMATALERVAKEGISIEQALGEGMAAAADMSLSAMEAEEREIAGFDTAELRDNAARPGETPQQTFNRAFFKPMFDTTPATEARRIEIAADAAYAAEQREILAHAPEAQPGYVDPEDRAYENEIEAWEENGIAAVEAKARSVDPRVARLQQIKAAEATKTPTEEQTQGRAR